MTDTKALAKRPRRANVAPLDRGTGSRPLLDAELVKFDPAMLGMEADPDDRLDAIADLGDVEGFHPNLAIRTSLKACDGSPVVVTDVQFIPTPPQFLEEKRKAGRDANEMTAVLFFMKPDRLYYVAVSGNNRIMKEAATIQTMLRRVSGVRCMVEKYTSTGGVGYHLSSGAAR